MITISFIFYLFSFFQKSATEAQKHVIPKSPLPIPKNYFRSPVDRPFFLAGAFGELRAGHFHSGIDIKSTDGAEGESIHAIGDGYISRISVKPDGYGNGIYITHPNGFTSVYAHLQKFNDAITKIMTEAQIKEQTVNFDFYPDTGRYMVRKGDIIGKMGNSGSSKGTHLHFEIRETDSETPINPFLFGYTIEDREAPRVNYVRLYGLDSNFNEYFGKNILVSTHNKLWVPRQGDTVDFKTDRLGIGINTRDGQEGNWNRNGIYEIKMFVNDSLWYQIRFDSVTFFTTRMINAHLDYPEHKFKKNYVHKCFTLPGNTLGIIKKDRDRGLLQINQKPTKINFEIIDFNRNLAKMQFFVKCSSNPAPMETGLYTYYLPYAQPNLIKTENVEINFPKFSFFTNTPFKYSYSADQSTHTYSGLHHIGDISVPVFGYYDLRILSSSIPDSLKPKAYIAKCNDGSYIQNFGGQWSGNWLKTQTRELGDYYIGIDTTKPTITIVMFNANMTKASRIAFKIDDELKLSGKTGYLNYEAYLDNVWIPMNYDLKSKTISYTFPKDFPRGTHQFKLMVSDPLGNRRIFDKSFVR